MRNYHIDFDRLVNELVPYYMGGRKFILLIQSLVKPLHSLNDKFVSWSYEKKIEANMTSQTIMMEWFLNDKLGKYLKDSSQRIFVLDSVNNSGVLLYWQNSTTTDRFTLYNSGETESTTYPNKPLKYEYERSGVASYSFFISSPPIDITKISVAEYKSMIKYWVEKYRISGKTFTIVINEK